MTNPIKLNWQGPLVMSGATPSPALAELDGGFAGVYIYYQCYTDKTVIYVGQARYLWSRIFQHIGSFARANYWLRDGTGEFAYHPKARGKDKMGYDDKIPAARPWSDLPALIQDNLHRLVFVWATFDGADKKEIRDKVEAYLIAQAKTLAGDENQYECDNAQEPDRGGVVLEHEISTLLETSSANTILQAITDTPLPQINKGGRLPRRLVD